jgi:DNA-binding beta-propeller fold protein YncE
MNFTQFFYRAAALLVYVAAIGCSQPAKSITEDATTASNDGTGTPQFQVDPFWPKTLPDEWLIGRIAGVAVDSQDRIFALHRPGSLTGGELGLMHDPPMSLCCRPAPPVLVFDPEGNLLDSWGGPGEGYDWPGTEHGIFVDHNDNVWLGGEGIGDPETLADHRVHGEDNPNCRDHFVLKFTNDGKFLMQIGKANRTGGNNSTEFLGHPADIAVDPETNEVFISDGYFNKRVIVFDAETAEYKRHWAAYGKVPDEASILRYDLDAPDTENYTDSVHAIVISKDGLVYVADRGNSRIQIFQKDGTYVEEHFIMPETRRGSTNGTVWDIDFSTDEEQTFLYVADGNSQRVWILRRSDMEVLDSFGRRGRGAGEFHWLHKFAVDSNGNIYTGEVHMQRRLQKFEVL